MSSYESAQATITSVEGNQLFAVLTLQHIQTDSTQSIDVGVINLSEEANLRRRHGVVVGQKQFESEDTTCIIVSQRSQEDFHMSPIPSYGDCAGP